MCFAPLPTGERAMEMRCPLGWETKINGAGVIIACCKTQKSEVVIYFEPNKQIYRSPFYKEHEANKRWIKEIFNLAHLILQKEAGVGLNFYLDCSTEIPDFGISEFAAISFGTRFLLDELFKDQNCQYQSHKQRVYK